MISTKLDDMTILDRLSYRNRHLGVSEYYIDENTFSILSSEFEEPDQMESFILYKNIEQLVLNLKNEDLACY